MRKHVTLLFLLRDDEILLAMKKRGFGEGKWNAPGGKTEPGETPERAAIRECQEEIGVIARNITQVGEIDFLMPHDPTFNHYAHVFVTREWDGEPTESEEMRPQWFTFADIPYKQMWSDDEQWVPLILAGKKFTARYVLGENDQLLESEIHEL